MWAFSLAADFIVLGVNFLVLCRRPGRVGSGLVSSSDPINIIIRFVAFASIGKIDNFYAAALPSENKIMKDCDALKITNHQRDLAAKKDRKASSYVARFIYKAVRITYASFIFYFLPYLALFIPLLFA